MGAEPRARRVLVLASSAELYGADRMLLLIASGLRRAGWEVVVVLPGPGPLVELLVERSCEVVVRRDFALRRRYASVGEALSLAGRAVSTLAWAVRAHRREPFALVYSNTHAVVLGPVLRMLLRRPHLWHVHEILERPAWLASLLIRLTNRGADRVVCTSESVRRHLVGRSPELAERAVVVFNGVDLGGMVDVEPVDPDGDRPLRAAVVGRLHPGKGQELVVEAVAKARAGGATVEVDLFGDTVPGNEAIVDQLLALARRFDVGDLVHLRGFEARREEIYRQVDVCVVASTVAESFSLVCAEAQACARPVIAPAEGGPAEVVVDGETGLLVEPRSPSALAAALDRACGDRRLLRSLGLAGRRRVVERFSAERFERDIVAVCDHLVGARAGRA